MCFMNFVKKNISETYFVFINQTLNFSFSDKIHFCAKFNQFHIIKNIEDFQNNDEYENKSSNNIIKNSTK